MAQSAASWPDRGNHEPEGRRAHGIRRRHPALLAAQRWPGRSRPPQSRTHPRLTEHRRREERKDIDDRVPPELAHLILQFDASILVDRTWGEVAGWCAAAAANVPGLQMVHELVTGKPSLEQARHLRAEHRALPGPRRALCRAAAVRGPQGGTEDLAGSKGAVERCSSSWRAGARTRSPAARKRPIVTPGLPHGVQVGVATSPRDSDPASVAAVHGPRLVSAAFRKMTCVGTPSGSSTDDRAEGLLAELEGGPDEDHRRA